MFESKILKLKPLVILVVLAVLILGFTCAGIVRHTSMHAVRGLHTLAVMPVDSQQECCATGVSKFGGSWKSLLSVAPRELRDGLFLLLLGLAAAVAISRARSQSDFKDVPLLVHTHAKDNPELAFSSHLKLAFARGILNPKIY